MEHKEIKIVIAALLAGGLVYFGMQYYHNKNDDNVKIQDTTSGDTGTSSGATKQEKMKALKEKMMAMKGQQKGAGKGDQSEKIKQMQDRLQKIEEKMKSLPADKQEKFKQVEEKIKAAIEKMQSKASSSTAKPAA